MNLIIPIIFILSSLGVFFGYIDPNYRASNAPTTSTDYSTYSVSDLQSELAKYQAVAQSSVSIVAEENDLIEKENTISTDNQDRLEKMLPANIDNIRLIIEISQIAQAVGGAKNISINSDSNGGNNASGLSSNSTSAGSGNQYNTVSVSFTVTTTYTGFLTFLQDLENNLRLADITNISFTANNTGTYNFNVTLNTYWLQ